MLRDVMRLARSPIRLTTALTAGALIACALVVAADARLAAPPSGTIAFVSDRAPNRAGEIYSIDVTGRRRRALTRAPLTADYAVTPSHDASKVAFVSNRDGTWAVWVMASRGGRPHRIGRLRGDPGSPTISWDRRNRRLAYDAGFYESVRPDVWVAPVDGGTPRRIGRGWHAQWSPTTDRIAFERYGGKGAAARAVVATPSGRVLWSRRGYAPQWSRDGRRLAFQTFGGAVALATARGRVVKRIGRQIEAYAWLPDSKHLVLVGRRTWVVTSTGRIVHTLPLDADPVVWSDDGERFAYRARTGIFVARIGGKPRRVARSGSLLMDWSADGRLIAAVAAGSHGPVITVVRTDGTGTVRIATEPPGSSIRAVYWAGNSRLIYESHGPYRGDLYLRMPGGVERRLTRGVARYDSPDWSPDRTRLVASRTDVECERDCPSGIAVIDALTGRAVRIAGPDAGGDRTFSETPRWSPDGRLIAFVRTGPPGDSLRVISADGEGERVLVQPTGDSSNARWPSWAPDGESIAFIGEGLTVVAADGTGARRIADAPDGAFGTAWSPDRRQIAWREGTAIKVVAADGGEPTVLRNAALNCALGTPSFSGSVAWSDSQRLLFAGCSHGPTALTNLDLWSVRSDGTRLTRLTRSLAWDRDPAVR